MISFSKKEKLIFDNNRGQKFEISVLSPFFLEDAEGIDSMENELYTSKSYNSDGVSVTGSNVKERNIVISGRILMADKEQNRAKMIRFFNPRHQYTLMYTNGTIARYIKCQVEKTPVITRDTLPAFMISFLCPHPWWYDKEIKVNIAMWVGTFEFPLEMPQETGIEMGYREPSLIVNVNNTSDIPSPLRVEFRAIGMLTNPSIINVETQEQIKIEYEMQAGDIISINTAQGSEYVRLSRNGVVSNLFNYLTLDSNPHFSVDVGDNLIRYNADANIENLDVGIYFTPQFVGV